MGGGQTGDGSRTDLLVGRQPILSADLVTVGYELLFRGARGPDQSAGMTAQVIVDALADIGLERLVGDRPAYLNVSRDFLLQFEPLPLPPDRVVLELLEDQVVDDALIGRLERIRREGFELALDDYRHRPGLEPLLAMASTVKLDVLALTDAELVEHIGVLAPLGVRLLAEKVETHEQFARCVELGMTLFQGYFFARPSTLRSEGVPAEQLASLDSLAALLRAEGDFEALEQVIRDDVGLVYKLLRWANSGLAGRGMPVESVHTALMRLGERPVRQWAMLATLAAGARTAPAELVRAAMLRGRVCELLCDDEAPNIRAAAYTVGLLSAVDALFNAPLEDLLGRLPLDPSIVAAIVAHDGQLGSTLERALALETDHPERAGIGGAPLVRAFEQVDVLQRSVT
jgi:c-di-GMP phosphodiesterase